MYRLTISYNIIVRRSISLKVAVELPLNIPLMEDVFPALSRPTTRIVAFLQRSIDSLFIEFELTQFYLQWPLH